jgi:hypothetical protein
MVERWGTCWRGMTAIDRMPQSPVLKVVENCSTIVNGMLRQVLLHNHEKCTLVCINPYTHMTTQPWVMKIVVGSVVSILDSVFTAMIRRA